MARRTRGRTATPTAAPPWTQPPHWPVARGELATRIRAYDWAQTPLGPSDTWPPSLRTAVEIALNTAFATFVWWGPDLVQLYNDASVAILGAEHPAALGRPARAVWADAWPIIERLVERVRRSGEAIRADLAVLPGRGGPREEAFFTVSYGPLHEAAGRVAGLVITAVETTTHVRAEAALRASAARQAFLLRLGDAVRPLADPVAVLDAATRLLGEHLAATRVGYAEDQGDGETVRVVHHVTAGVPGIAGIYRYDDYGPALLRAFRAGRTVVRPDIAADPTLTEEEKAAHAALDLGATVNVPLVKAGRLVAIFFVHYRTAHAFSAEEVALIEEVAERTWEAVERAKAEDRLRASEARFRALADHIPYLAWMARADGYMYWYNSRWYEYTGTTPEQMEGWGWRAVHDPAVLPAVLEQWTASIASGTPFEMVFPLKGHDGVFRPFLTRVAPVRDAQGQIVHWFGTNTDITAQKDLERQKDHFLSMAAHELKTPITSLKAVAQVLQRRAAKRGDAESERFYATMDLQINRLTALVTGLLDVSRIDVGKLTLDQHFFDLETLAADTVEMVQGLTTAHRVIPAGTVGQPVCGDRDRIAQVLINLLTNAVKFSPGGGEIHLHVRSEAGQARVSVQDQGVGIAAEHLDKIFDRFYQVDDARTRPFAGLGIGLYIAAEIIRRHGGDIWVDSTPGAGSTFTFTLPLPLPLPLPTP